MAVKTVALLLCGSLLAGCVAYERRYYEPGVSPVSPADVASMTRAGYSEAHILRMIQANGVAWKPSADELIMLRTAGVSDYVQSAMIEAPVTAYRPPVEHRTVVYHDYAVEPAFNLGVGLFAGYMLGRHFRCR